ncbi:GntR family transcriptional regulator [Streptomyces sp. CMB-StM0423]|uniref:GntR family transcriptional regulator n=1 Tax=Streptomyces sp. CMB-StM0423 TaxID=2059884 RepID=UPI000C70872C|nr:GntR family transcriptional regulator [Streptomyces sp. CMB-StM0423]AUH39984.1 GntR family transcriptional regulator [Streptomyces sp. CMB-StM0423]
MAVDRSDPRPLHQQVAQSLRQQILGHDLPPGAPLPSEAELCATFGVGRSVVRQSVAGLAADGLVIRRQGRPTLVASPAEYRRLVQRATGLSDQFAVAGQELHTVVRTLGPGTPPPRAQAFLHTADALRLERLRLVGGDPLAYVRTWLPAAKVPGLRAADLTDASLHRLLTRNYGLRPVSGRRQVRAVAADDMLAEALRTEPGGPLLMLEGETTDQHGHALEWFTTWHRADRVVFDIDVSETTETVRLSALDAEGAEAPEAGPVTGGTGAPAPADLERARELAEELRRLLG